METRRTGSSLRAGLSMTLWMYLVDPKDHILKVSCPYLHFWLKYMDVNKAYNTYINSHVTKYWPLIGQNFSPRYWGGASSLAIFSFTSIHSGVPNN